VATKKHLISAVFCACVPLSFREVFVSLSKLGYSNFIFIEPGLKSTRNITETCYWRSDCYRWCT